MLKYSEAWAYLMIAFLIITHIHRANQEKKTIKTACIYGAIHVTDKTPKQDTDMLETFKFCQNIKEFIND